MRIGLTGGIGSGKTTVARLIEQEGFPVYISDRRASELMNGSEEVRCAIMALMGESVYPGGGDLDRKRMAELLFADKKALQQVNAIVHPAVMADFDRWCKSKESPFLFFESAIIFEAGLEGYFDKVVVVSASVEARLRRVCNRDGASEKEVAARMRHQMEEEERCRRADYVIYTDRGMDEPEQVREMIQAFGKVSEV